MTNFTFSAITFEPVEIQEHIIPQNKRCNLLDMEDFMLFVAKMDGRGRKKDVYKFATFPSIKIPGNSWEWENISQE